MFAQPRPRKSALPPPPPKRRRVAHTVEEIKFDDSARSEYLTGFHKRKLQRAKRAQEEAAKRTKQEKIELRKQVREERKREVEEHVQNVNAILRQAEHAGHIDAAEEDSDEDKDGEITVEEWGGFTDEPVTAEETLDHEEEYIDEDRYTTVTVESVNISRDGFNKTQAAESSGDEANETPQNQELQQPAGKKTERPPKKKKQKFRYESKAERSLAARKQRSKNKR